jgi:hypothetical protein
MRVYRMDKNQQFLRRGGDTYPRSKMRGCTAQYFQAAMGVDSLKACETRRIELILRHCCSMRVKLFLGRGQKAKWFVLQQPLIFPSRFGNTSSTVEQAFGCT